MKLTTKGKYGVKALFELAMHEGNTPLSLKTIAERQDLSEHYLEQLVAPLRRAGLVTSVRGAQGGYMLSRPAAQITVGDIIRVLEGPIGYSDCATEGGALNGCENAETCLAHGVWEKVRDAIVKVVDGITLADLCEQAREEAERQNIMYHI
ncbi:MAG: RrF2 family transcriptional regulator [Symbiobacteriia bacterium]